MNTLIMTVGLPGQGKTTYLQDNAEEICAIYDIQHRLSSDDVIEETAQALTKTYTEVFEDTIKLAQDFVFTMTGLLSLQKQSFIIDRTGLSKKSRQSLLAKLNNKEDYKKIALVFNDVSPDELRKRLDQRGAIEGKIISEELIARMAASFQYPSLDEGFDAIMTVEEFHATLPQINKQAFGSAAFA